jgi:hypothetical protein
LLGAGGGGVVVCGSVGFAGGSPRGMLTGPVCVEGSCKGTVIPEGWISVVGLLMVTKT